MKNVKLIKICFLFALAGMLQIKIVNSQNLVPNPSFEEYHYCFPEVAGVVKNWNLNINTSDYLNSCAPNSSGLSVPTNSAGYQYANSGDAYFGFFSFVRVNGINVSEYFGCKLNNALSIGEEYYFSCKVSLSNNSFCANNNIGALFLTEFNANVEAVIDNDTIYEIIIETPPYSYCKNFSHINCTSIIIDTTNWQTIAGTFTADSAYNYMLIGNFFTSNLTDTLLLNGTDCISYYYIDDVCLSSDPTFCDSLTKIIEEQKNECIISIFPNPTEKYFNVEIQKINDTDNIYFELYNALGRLLLDKPLTSTSTVINTEQLKPGVYFVKIYIGDKMYVRKLFINH